jgi:hypothetical protein
MTLRESVLQQALLLNREDRAYVVAGIVESLSIVAANEIFASELHRRSAAYRSGATTARAAADVIRDLTTANS